MSEELLLYLDRCRFCHGDTLEQPESTLIDDAIEKCFFFLSNVEVRKKIGNFFRFFKFPLILVQDFSVSVEQNLLPMPREAE